MPRTFVSPVTVAGAVEQGADEQFGLGVLAAYLAHQLRAFFWSQAIHDLIKPPASLEITEYHQETPLRTLCAFCVSWRSFKKTDGEQLGLD